MIKIRAELTVCRISSKPSSAISEDINIIFIHLIFHCILNPYFCILMSSKSQNECPFFIL